MTGATGPAARAVRRPHWRSSPRKGFPVPHRATRPSAVTVYYDADCGFCIWTVALLLRLDRGRRVTPATIQGAVHGDLATVPADRVMTSFHARADGAPPVSAGAALTVLLCTLGPLRPIGRLTARFPRLTDRAYFAVANRRGRWATLIPERSKRWARRVVAARTPG